MIFNSCQSEHKKVDDPLKELLPGAGHSWNTPLNYLNSKNGSIFIIRDNFVYGDYSIIEFTPFLEKGKRELRLHEFDLMTVNEEFGRRGLPIFENSKSKLRNVMTFIFDYPQVNAPDFRSLKTYNDNKHQKYIESSHNKYSYFVLNTTSDTLFWVDVNDGISKSEQKFLNWMKPLANKISAQEKLYYDFVIGKRDRYQPILSTKRIIEEFGDEFIIPSGELKWNVK